MTRHANAICLVTGNELDAVELAFDDLDSVLGGVSCYDIGTNWARARDSGDAGMMAFWSGAYVGFGCTK